MALDPGTVAALRRQRQRRAEERLAVGPGWHDRRLVFTDVAGAPLHPGSVSATFTRRVRALGLPTISIHGLRHTWATLALAAGIHPKVVQERLGHSSIAITLGIYSHVTPGMDEAAAQHRVPTCS